VCVKGAGEGFSLTPFVAGHLIGGCIWRVTNREEEHIVYAVHYNHRKEGHLNGAVLESAFLRPAVLITDADNALHNPPDNKDKRNREFLDTIMNALRSNGAHPSLLPRGPLSQPGPAVKGTESVLIRTTTGN